MRIITGSARGARLLTPMGMATRPTSDRIKEAAFSILGDKVRGRRVLDLFAGSGALGLEALSRGAESAVFVDQRTADFIRKNAVHTHLEGRCRILAMDALQMLGRAEEAGESYDLIFSDPPYGKGLTEEVLARLSRGHVLAEDGILVLEHGAQEGGFTSETLSCVLARSYGRVTKVGFFQRKSFLGEEEGS